MDLSYVGYMFTYRNDEIMDVAEYKSIFVVDEKLSRDVTNSLPCDIYASVFRTWLIVRRTPKASRNRCLWSSFVGRRMSPSCMIPKSSFLSDFLEDFLDSPFCYDHNYVVEQSNMKLYKIITYNTKQIVIFFKTLEIEVKGSLVLPT